MKAQVKNKLTKEDNKTQYVRFSFFFVYHDHFFSHNFLTFSLSYIFHFCIYFSCFFVYLYICFGMNHDVEFQHKDRTVL